jgi:hypothetical protein
LGAIFPQRLNHLLGGDIIILPEKAMLMLAFGSATLVAYRICDIELGGEDVAET